MESSDVVRRLTDAGHPLSAFFMPVMHAAARMRQGAAAADTVPNPFRAATLPDAFWQQIVTGLSADVRFAQVLSNLFTDSGLRVCHIDNDIQQSAVRPFLEEQGLLQMCHGVILHLANAGQLYGEAVFLPRWLQRVQVPQASPQVGVVVLRDAEPEEQTSRYPCDFFNTLQLVRQDATFRSEARTFEAAGAWEVWKLFRSEVAAPEESQLLPREVLAVVFLFCSYDVQASAFAVCRSWQTTLFGFGTLTFRNSNAVARLSRLPDSSVSKTVFMRIAGSAWNRVCDEWPSTPGVLVRHARVLDCVDIAVQGSANLVCQVIEHVQTRARDAHQPVDVQLVHGVVSAFSGHPWQEVERSQLFRYTESEYFCAWSGCSRSESASLRSDDKRRMAALERGLADVKRDVKEVLHRVGSLTVKPCATGIPAS